MVDLASLITPRFLFPYEINQSEIEKICALKNQSWPHSMESQLVWWDKNTAVNDLLVTLVCEDSILAFLRLRSRAVSVGEARLNALCVTEVCVDKEYQKQGLGAMLMSAANTKIEQSGLDIAYLVCRDIQELFYDKSGWRRVHASLQIESSTGARRLLAKNESCMAYNLRKQFKDPVVLYGDVF